MSGIRAKKLPGSDLGAFLCANQVDRDDSTSDILRHTGKGLPRRSGQRGEHGRWKLTLIRVLLKSIPGHTRRRLASEPRVPSRVMADQTDSYRLGPPNANGRLRI